MSKYLRQNSKGEEQVVLDLNAVYDQTTFCSFGQVKLSSDQQLVAYTLDLDSSEVFETRIQSIEGAPLSRLPFTLTDMFVFTRHKCLWSSLG